MRYKLGCVADDGVGVFADRGGGGHGGKRFGRMQPISGLRLWTSLTKQRQSWQALEIMSSIVRGVRACATG